MELAAGEKRGEYGNGRGGAVVTAMQRNFHRNSDRNEEKDGFMRRPKRVQRERGGQPHHHYQTTVRNRCFLRPRWLGQ